MISVLIVDDHPVVREGLETMLSTRKGFSVVGLCADGESAVKFCRAKGCPDVIVCDIRMPKMDGFEMIARLRRFYPDAKVLLLAGMPLVIEVEKAASVGAKGYLPKSVDPALYDRMNEKISAEIIESGYAYIVTTTLNGKKCLRIITINGNTETADVLNTIEKMKEIAENVRAETV